MGKNTFWVLDIIIITLVLFFYFSDSTAHSRKLLLPSPLMNFKINKREERLDFINPIIHQSGYLIIGKKSNKVKGNEQKRWKRIHYTWRE